MESLNFKPPPQTMAKFGELHIFDLLLKENKNPKRTFRMKGHDIIINPNPLNKFHVEVKTRWIGHLEFHTDHLTCDVLAYVELEKFRLKVVNAWFFPIKILRKIEEYRTTRKVRPYLYNLKKISNLNEYVKIP